MPITEAMLTAAVKKAVEVGLLPPAEWTLEQIDENWRNIKAVLEATLAAADDVPESRLEAERTRALEAARERNAITRLCYRKVETASFDRDTYYRIVLETVHDQAKTHDTEPEVIAAVRRLAGLDAAADEERPATDVRPADPFAGCRYVVFTEILDRIDAITHEPVSRDTPMVGTNDRAVADWYAADLAFRSGRHAWVVDRGEAKPDED